MGNSTRPPERARFDWFFHKTGLLKGRLPEEPVELCDLADSELGDRLEQRVPGGHGQQVQ